MLFQCLVWYGKDNDSQRDCKRIGQKGKYVVLCLNFFIRRIEIFSYIIPHYFFHDSCFLFRDPFLNLSFFLIFPLFLLLTQFFLLLLRSYFYFPIMFVYSRSLIISISWLSSSLFVWSVSSSSIIIVFSWLNFLRSLHASSPLSYFYFLPLSPPPRSIPSFFPSLLLPFSLLM